MENPIPCKFDENFNLKGKIGISNFNHIYIFSGLCLSLLILFLINFFSLMLSVVSSPSLATHSIWTISLSWWDER